MTKGVETTSTGHEQGKALKATMTEGEERVEKNVTGNKKESKVINLKKVQYMGTTKPLEGTSNDQHKVKNMEWEIRGDDETIA